MKMTNKVYDILKWVALVVLPALATLYLSLGSIWQGIINIPYPEAVSATIMALDAAIGTILGISSIKYNNQGE